MVKREGLLGKIQDKWREWKLRGSVYVIPAKDRKLKLKGLSKKQLIRLCLLHEGVIAQLVREHNITDIMQYVKNVKG